MINKGTVNLGNGRYETTIIDVCRACHGSGLCDGKECSTCAGSGIVEVKKLIITTIKPLKNNYK